LFYSFVRDYRLVYAIQALEGSSWAAYVAAATAYVADIISPRTFLIGAVITGMNIIPALIFIKEVKPSDKSSGQQSIMLK